MKNLSTILLLITVFLFSTFSTSFAQLPWTKDANNPVMSGGASGTWNNLVMMPDVLYNSDSSRYEMWYAGSPGSPNRPYRIGFATSPDGITWTKIDTAVLKPTAGTWDESTVELPRVIKENGLYKMWYTGWSPSHEAGGIGYATSPNGVNWTKHQGNPVLFGTDAWEAGGINYGSVMPVPGGYKMWYTGFNVNYSESGIGYATSPNGINWQRDTLNNPVLTPGTPGQWDNPLIFSPDVVFIDSVYHMWYTGQQSSNVSRRIGWASSDDGIQWTKYDNTNTTSVLYASSDPVLTPTSGQWDGSKVETGSVMLEGDSLRMWYDGWLSPAPPNLLSIGHATAPLFLNVPNVFATIQAAIDAATEDDIVLVDDGTYQENINFKGKAITVASHYYFDGDTSHISNTIIDGSSPSHPDSGSVVSFVSGEDTNSVLCGFTITNGTGTPVIYGTEERIGGGILCYNSGASIVSNKIINNSVTYDKGNGGGIGVLSTSNIKVNVLDNEIKNNIVNGPFGAYGGGLLIVNASGKISGNVINNNSCISSNGQANGGGVGLANYLVHAPYVNVIDNDICYNSVDGADISPGGAYGAGMYIKSTNAVVLHNKITNNESIDTRYPYGSGLCLSSVTDITVIDGNIISQNVASNYSTGGGIGVLFSTDPVIVNNMIDNNIAFGGGGIYILHSNPEIINNTIINNIALAQGGGIYTLNSSPIVVNSILWSDSVSVGSEVFVASGSIEIRFSDIKGGYTGEGNINSDPLFVPGDTLYNLSDSSLCIGAGSDSVDISGTWYYCPTTDYDGDPRPNPVDMYVDIGAQESAYPNPSGIIKEDSDQLPIAFSLKQNYPNPFNPRTNIQFSIPKTEFVTLKIYNLLGQEMADLVSKKLILGNYKYTWDASLLASGIYFYKLEAGNFINVKKLILLK